jgi:hypothetical protein
MKITDRELELLEELRQYGTPVDGTVLREARTARRGLDITQTGNCVEDVLYAQASGRIEVMARIAIENMSDRVVPIKEVRLEMPWPAPDFHWLKRLSSKQARKYGGYVLPACGPHGFDPSEVLNDLFVRDFKLHRGCTIEGFPLGEGTASVPDEYQDRMLIPVQLVVFTGRCEPYRAWLKLTVRREGQRRIKDAVDKQVQPKTVRTGKGKA